MVAKVAISLSFFLSFFLPFFLSICHVSAVHVSRMDSAEYRLFRGEYIYAFNHEGI